MAPVDGVPASDEPEPEPKSEPEPEPESEVPDDDVDVDAPPELDDDFESLRLSLR